MYAAVVLFIFMCLTTSHADHHHPCHSHNMSGLMSVLSSRGDTRAFGAFTYDSVGQKLRFQSNESSPTNSSIGLDLLMYFAEGILYEIDSKNQSCEKKKLQMTSHPLDIPDDAKFSSTVTYGSSSIEDEGLKLNVWGGKLTSMKGSYTINLDVELEIKDPDLLVVPSFCHGKPLEDTPEGTVNSFLNEFM